MQDLGDPHQSRSGGPSPLPTLGRRRRSAKGPNWGLVALLLAVVAGGIWALTQFLGGPEDPSLTTAPTDTLTAPLEGSLDDVPPLDLPELGMSDAFVRRLVAALSARPELARWLVTDDLIERFVRVIVDLAGSSTPAANVRVMAPPEPFRVQESNGRLTIAPESFTRYNAIAATFASLDTRGTVRLYRQLLPLVEDAYAELGIPNVTFQETLTMAIRNVLAVEIPEGPVQVVEDEAVYIFADPALEARRGLVKQLLRMGPDNARLIQSKTRELAAALGIEP